MRARPARHRWSGEPKPVQRMKDTKGIVVECDVIYPESSKGRQVYVFISGDEVVWLMKELKKVALAQRSKPMSAH